MVDNQGKQIPSYITTIWGITPKKRVGCYRWLGWMMMYNLAVLRFACKRCLETRNKNAQMVVKHGDFTRIESVKHHQLNKEKKLVSLWEGQKNPGKFTAGTLNNSPN